VRGKGNTGMYHVAKLLKKKGDPTDGCTEKKSGKKPVGGIVSKKKNSWPKEII